MRILVCVKRVPDSGGTPQITDDGTGIDTRHLSFTVGPHEECALEEAITIAKDTGGEVTVLTVGSSESVEQLRYGLSMGAHRGVLVENDDPLADPQQVAEAISQAVRQLQDDDGAAFDLILFGNESPDAGNYQTGIRVAADLGLPMVGRINHVDVDESAGRIMASRDGAAGTEVFQLDLPAALAVREGLNLPRYPSMPGRLRARKAEIMTYSAGAAAGGLRLTELKVPEDLSPETVILGHGPEAAPAIVDMFEELEVL